MKQSIDSTIETFPEDLLFPSKHVTSLERPRIPPGHPAEPDVFARHEGVPGHVQSSLKSLRVFLVGGGGLNSWAALGLVRTGTGAVAIADSDIIDRTNLSRQLYFASDLGQRKADRLAHNIALHAIDDIRITGIPLSFEDAIEEFAVPSDILRYISGRR